VRSAFYQFMPAVFDKLGIRFQYPENWTLETDSTTPGRQSVSVYSPGGGYWSVMAHPANSDPAELATAALDIMKAEYDELDSESAQEEIGGVQLTGFDLNFYCLDLINSARIRVFSTQRANYLVICQAEDREFERLSPVFQAMTTSLISS
jgi:hypothetical protein